ncbi:hypothetical protein ACP70R_031813 [Stipagrostis hirtigluma subsp. patula]
MATATRSHVTYCRAAVVLLAFLRHAPLGTAQPLPWQLSNDTAANYTANNIYQANIYRLAITLSANASSSPALFATGATGTAPDAVYALALCRGDTTNITACASCVATVFQNAQQLCALRRGATMYDDPCILRYADWDSAWPLSARGWATSAARLRHQAAVSRRWRLGRGQEAAAFRVLDAMQSWEAALSCVSSHHSDFSASIF